MECLSDQYMYIITSKFLNISHSYEQYYSIILIITYWMRYLKQPSFALLISQLLLVIQKMS